jgi:plasmid stability protein
MLAIPMATIIVRNLDDEVAARLRLQARLHGVSVEQEARRVLAEGTRPSRAEIAARAATIRARQRPHRSRGADLIREERDR